MENTQSELMKEFDGFCHWLHELMGDLEAAHSTIKHIENTSHSDKLMRITRDDASPLGATLLNGLASTVEAADQAMAYAVDLMSMLKSGAGKLADGESASGVNSWSATTLYELNEWHTAWNEWKRDGYLCRLRTGFEGVEFSPTGMASTVKEDWDGSITSYEYFARARGLLSAALNTALDGISVSPEEAKSQTGDFRTGRWFQDATNELLTVDTLRKAGYRGRIQREKQGKDWTYSVDQVKNHWRDYAKLIDAALLEAETAGHRRKLRDK